MLDIFTKEGLRVVGVVFGVGFLTGLIVTLVGLTMAVNLMATAAGAK